MIKLENISKTYDLGVNKVYALKNINLPVKEGDFTAIMGPSGSGKSTLMNIIGLMDRPTEGRFILDGISTDVLDEKQLSALRNRKIGFVFQNFNLLPRLNALRNVELPLLYAGIGASERRNRAKEALAQVGLASHIAHRPNELSGGQRQRVAIARALINNPSLILADEPTGNLDSASGYEIMELFQKLHQLGITIIIVTHEPEIARHTQRVVHFRDGRIVSNEEISNPYQARDRLNVWLSQEEMQL